MSFLTHSATVSSVWGKGATHRDLAEETAIAIVVNGTTLAVMMATPADVEAFGIGFLLTERIVADLSDILEVEVIDHELGLEVRLWIDDKSAKAMLSRRRQQAGPTGCGLCGIESLEAAMRDIKPVSAQLTLSPQQVLAAMASLYPAQALNKITRAVHAAGLWHPQSGLLAICEDVGRHNALDKLAGRSAQLGLPASECAVLLTSRVSIELIQKTAAIGTPMLIAVSAPTSLAVRQARRANITLIGVTRSDGFEVFDA